MKGVGGGKRGGRKPTMVEPDDCPRGYEATRMRQLWRDIDHAKHKAGLGSAPEPAAAPTWGFAAVIEQATALAGDAAAWVTTNAPAACAFLASGAELLRGVPVVGRLVDLVPTLPMPTDAQQSHLICNGNGRAKGRTTGVEVQVEPPDGEPNGKWIH